MNAAAAFACLPGLTPQCLIQNFDKHRDDDDSETLLPAPREVFPTEVEAVEPFPTDSVVFDGRFTLLKSRMSTSKTVGGGKNDHLPGKIEGGLKVWDSTIDLVNTMRREMKDGQLSFRGKRVLEVGCGHGLPGTFAILKGANTVHFQDFSAEVLKRLTIPTVISNLEQSSPGVHYYAGEWGNVCGLLSMADSDSSSDLSGEETQRGSPPLRRKRSSSSRAFERAIFDGSEGGYDIILMSETVYSLESLPKLYNLIKKCLKAPYGVVYVAGKKHYLSSGGGTRQFRAVVDEDGTLGGHLVTDFGDGPSNIREIWKFFFR